MSARASGSRWSRTLAVAWPLAAIALANVAATRFHGRVDLTEDRVYTLSAPSRELVRALPDYLTIKAYVSRDLPPEPAARGRYVRELLDEYRMASGGKVRVDLYDRDDAKVEAAAARCGIERSGFQVRRGQKVEAVRATLGLCFWYDGRSRSLASLAATPELEYQISALIKRMTQKPGKIGFSTGHGERDLGDGYSFVKLALEQEHEVVTFDPSVNAIADDVDVLIVAGPRRPFDERARIAVERFLAAGKGVAFLLDGAAPAPADDGEGRMAGAPIDTGLRPLLARYGFEVAPKLVFDRQNAPGPVGPKQGGLVANRPAFVEVTPAKPSDKTGASAAEIPTEIPTILAGIPAMVFPFPSPVGLVGPLGEGAHPAGTLWTLARTSSGIPLAYAYRGASASATPAPRLLVIGDSAFAADEYMALARGFPIYAGGAEMFLRAVGWMLEDDALAPLRENTHRARPLRVEAEQEAAAITWGNAVGVPIAFCAAGLLRWRLRRAAQRRQKLGPREVSS